MKRQKTVGKALALTLILSVALQPFAIKAANDDETMISSNQISNESGVLSSVASQYQSAKDYVCDTWNDDKNNGKAKVIGGAGLIAGTCYGLKKAYDHCFGEKENQGTVYTGTTDTNKVQNLTINVNQPQQNQEKETLVNKLWNNKGKVLLTAIAAGIAGGYILSPETMNSAASSAYNSIGNHWSKVVGGFQALTIYDYFNKKLAEEEQHQNPGQTPDLFEEDQIEEDQIEEPVDPIVKKPAKVFNKTIQSKNNKQDKYAHYPASVRAWCKPKDGSKGGCANGRCSNGKCSTKKINNNKRRQPRRRR